MEVLAKENSKSITESECVPLCVITCERARVCEEEGGGGGDILAHNFYVNRKKSLV